MLDELLLDKELVLQKLAVGGLRRLAKGLGLEASSGLRLHVLILPADRRLRGDRRNFGNSRRELPQTRPRVSYS